MSIYNEDELVPPTWINREFMQKVVEHFEKTEDVMLTDLIISPATLKGDHYGSIMFRCKITYYLIFVGETKKKSWIIKTLPSEDCTKRDLLQESGFFEVEISMYSETIPKIEQILEEAGIGTKMGAKIIYHSLSPNKLIILEDLCEAGYDAVRGRPLNEDEIKLIYKKIAKFHAVTHMLGQSEDHETVTRYTQGLFCNPDIVKMDMIRNGITHFIEMLGNYEEFAVYLEKIKVMEPQMFEAIFDLYKAYSLHQGKGDIFVLNHGDFHIKNLMFKHNKDNQVEDVIMVDYQLNVYGPSAVDITYSEYTMLSLDLRMRRHELMLYYFIEFIKALKTLNFKGKFPLYSDFQIASLRYRHFDLFLIATFLPMFKGFIVSKAEDLKDIDSTKLMENVDVIKKSYTAPAFVDDVRRYLPVLLREGYLD